MKGVQGYRESRAWMQTIPFAPLPSCRIEGPTEAAFAMEECRAGLEALFVGQAVTDDAGFAITYAAQDMPPEAFTVRSGLKGIDILALDARGWLYGTYALMEHLRTHPKGELVDITSSPAVHRRAINHWDNMDGRIERGYSGKSIFFRDGDFQYDPERIREYARLLASVGINEISINNVNVTERSAQLITPTLLPELAAVADIFRPFGIRLLVAVHFESPVLLGGLPTSDPLDKRVAKWWRDAAADVYAHIPDLAGFVVKADSEFRGGPASLGRTQADGANVIAQALAPHDGIVYWRCFVYDCMQDWRDMQTDRPMAAYEHFQPLDGQFLDNVILQIKYGPSDFQVREPLSPLLGSMPSTQQALELQVTQEYTGQQIDLYALPVQWEELFAMPVTDTRSALDLMGREITATAAVSNVGDDENWTGHTLAQANLYGYGKMAWNPALTAREVLQQWAKLTFGQDETVLLSLMAMLLSSRAVYEKYNAPLGIGWMVNVGRHYGPSVDGYEYMRWGTYHRADHLAIGVDRTGKGTGFTAQYHPAVAAQYESLDTCPEEMVLFFHRLPYDYTLKSGKKLLQHIYDTHFEGVEAVEGFIDTWRSLEPLLPQSAYRSVLQRLQMQLEDAREWRDVINTYFFRKTGIPDAQGRKIYP